MTVNIALAYHLNYQLKLLCVERLEISDELLYIILMARKMYSLNVKMLDSLYIGQMIMLMLMNWVYQWSMILFPVLVHEQMYLDNLPCSEYYEKSFMHRDTVTQVVVTK